MRITIDELRELLEVARKQGRAALETRLERVSNKNKALSHENKRLNESVDVNVLQRLHEERDRYIMLDAEVVALRARVAELEEGYPATLARTRTRPFEEPRTVVESTPGPTGSDAPGRSSSESS